MEYVTLTPDYEELKPMFEEQRDDLILILNKLMFDPDYAEPEELEEFEPLTRYEIELIKNAVRSAIEAIADLIQQIEKYLDQKGAGE